MSESPEATPRYVHKYGGTSVGSVERIHAVADRVARSLEAGQQVVVVLSAMAGETDRLEELAREVAEEIAPRERDVLLSSGEQVSIALLAMALIERGFAARSYLGWQVRILTDDAHTRARIEHIDTEALNDDLANGVTPIIAGFQGIDTRGNMTTFGRGGSDTTAVAVAAAIGADECRIYTDVDGVHTADPRIVEDAAMLHVVTFEEMLELASLGSKVLHPRAVEFAGKYGVPLRVLSSFGDGDGTLITTEENDMEQPVVSGIAYSRDEAKLTLLGVPDVPGIASKILGPIADANIEVDMIVQNVGADGSTDFTFTVKREDFVRALELLEAVKADLDARSVEGDNRIVKVSVVGVGMRSHAGVATRMFDALAAENINIRMISTSEIKISVVVDERYLELAVRAIHATFDLSNPPVKD
ncbi:MAG: aspartate kinase [Gammaproteobacteria bacterium]|nr:aspartate kinase [Gammaproteobacteria bacterium]MDE0225511.1 aspartate kinase [Gammaproteobacteria bacterium]